MLYHKSFYPFLRLIKFNNSNAAVNNMTGFFLQWKHEFKVTEIIKIYVEHYFDVLQNLFGTLNSEEFFQTLNFFSIFKFFFFK